MALLFALELVLDSDPDSNFILDLDLDLGPYSPLILHDFLVIILTPVLTWILYYFAPFEA